METRSPALIEQVRRATTDASGRYRFEGLPPGTYSLRVRAPDLGERRYEGLEVRSGSTATLDVQMPGPGGVSETITVTARSPAIDTDSAERRIVLPGDVVKALPTARSYNALIVQVLRFGRARTLVALETYNVLNSSAVLAYNSTFVPGGTWLQPLTILTPRLFKLTAQVDF